MWAFKLYIERMTGDFTARVNITVWGLVYTLLHYHHHPPHHHHHHQHHLHHHIDHYQYIRTSRVSDVHCPQSGRPRRQTPDCRSENVGRRSNASHQVWYDLLLRLTLSTAITFLSRLGLPSPSYCQILQISNRDIWEKPWRIQQIINYIMANINHISCL